MNEPRSLPRSEPEPLSTHPEEMKAVFDLRVGKWISLQGSARMTPAGIVTVGITTAATALAFLAVARAWNASRR